MTLKKNQTIRKAELAKIEFYFKRSLEMDETTSKSEVHNRLVALEKSYEDLCKANIEILHNKDTDPDVNLQENLKADEEYITAKSRLQDLLPQSRNITRH